jgi:hypothetical protein
MRSWLVVTLGILLLLVGGVWTLQGVGVLGGSAMTGERMWAVIGPIVAVVGAAIVVVALRSRRRAGAAPSAADSPD